MKRHLPEYTEGQMAKKMAVEQTEIWVQWCEQPYPSKVKVNSDTDINDFLKMALNEMKLDLAPGGIEIESYKTIDRSKHVATSFRKNSYKTPLYLRHHSMASSYFREVPEIPMSVSPSVYGTDHDTQIVTQSRALIYQHWFALKVYKLFTELENLESNEETLSITLADKEIEIDRIELAKFVASMRRICDLIDSANQETMYLKEAKTCELTFTSLLCRCLDRFLFPDSHKERGAVLHQMPTNGEKKHLADFFICLLEEMEPGNILLAGDYKLKDDKVAYHQTIAYCIESVKIYTKQRVILGLSGSGDKFKLLLCQNDGQKRLQIIELIESHDGWMRFACVLFACVRYLETNPITQSPPTKMAVRCEDVGVKNHEVITNRVVKCVRPTCNRIHKFYDSVKLKAYKHNYKLIKELKLLPDCELVSLDKEENGRFHRLSYNYLEPVETSEAIRFEDFKPLLEKLSKLHAKNLVHSDVRLENIIFTKEGAHLIDFDLVDKEGKCYPAGYNEELSVRHESAKPLFPRRKEHDLHSIRACIFETVESLPADFDEQFDSFFSANC